MQPVEDPPLGQRDDGVGLSPGVVLQRPERVYEAVVLLLERHDPRREEAAEAKAIPLRHGERRVLVEPWVVEDVGAALVDDAGAGHRGAGRGSGGRRRRRRRHDPAPPDLRRRPPRRVTPHRAPPRDRGPTMAVAVAVARARTESEPIPSRRPGGF